MFLKKYLFIYVLFFFFCSIVNSANVKVCQIIGPTPYLEEKARISGQLNYLKNNNWTVNYLNREHLNNSINLLESADVILFGREHNTWKSSKLEQYNKQIQKWAENGKIVIIDSLKNTKNRWLLESTPFTALKELFNNNKVLSSCGTDSGFWHFPNDIIKTDSKKIKVCRDINGIKVYGNGTQKPFSLAILETGKGMIVVTPNFIDAKLVENLYVWKLMKTLGLCEISRLKLPMFYYGSNKITLDILKKRKNTCALNLTLYSQGKVSSQNQFKLKNNGNISKLINIPAGGIGKVSAQIIYNKRCIYKFSPKFDSRQLFYVYSNKGIFENEPLSFTSVINSVQKIFPLSMKWTLKSYANGTLIAKNEETIVDNHQEIQISIDKDIIGTLLFQADLYKGEQKIAEQTVKLVTAMVPKKRNRITFRNDNTMLINGKPFFPIWGSRVSNGQLKGMQQSGFNAITDMKDFAQLGSSRFSPDDVNRAANFIAEYNMKKMAMLNWEFWNKYGRNGNGEYGEGLRQEIARYRNNPAIIVNYLMDEPPIHLLGKVVTGYNLVKKLDPFHPVAVCIMHMDKKNIQETVKKVSRFCDILMVDPYPIPYRGMDETWQQIDSARKVYNDKMPVMCWLQAFSYSTDRSNHALGRFPTKQELRCQTYLALTHGARGIGYFCLNWLDIGRLDLNRKAFWNALTGVVSEVRSLVPALTSANHIVGGKEKGMPLHWFISKVDSKIYLLVVNSSKRNLKVKIALSGLKMPFDEFFESRLMYPQNEAFQEDFSPYGVHVYMFEGINKLTKPKLKLK